MDPPPFSSSHHVGVRKGNPFVAADPLSQLSLKETCEFVEAFPVGVKSKRNMGEAPPTPGRPVFSFSVGRKNPLPSKWNDAEKWLISDHNQNHHLHGFVSRKSNAGNGQSQTKVISEEKVEIFKDSHHYHNSDSSFDVLKDKFTNESETNFLKFECSEPLSESFLFKESSMVKSRDIGTEMTPLGSSTTSRCPTPFKTMSPPRHNTPASRSGPMDPTSSFNAGELRDCHLAKLKLGTTFDLGLSNWSSREEEEEDVSKSLRHFEMSNESRKTISEPRASAWEEEEKIKCCLRYQREEAKIQAWVDLQNAKAEAQSRKLEVKIQKMRSKFEEKMMREIAIVHRKAEEFRVAARLQHTDKLQNQHLNMHYSASCGCFPCNNLHP